MVSCRAIPPHSFHTSKNAPKIKCLEKEHMISLWGTAGGKDVNTPMTWNPLSSWAALLSQWAWKRKASGPVDYEKSAQSCLPGRPVHRNIANQLLFLKKWNSVKGHFSGNESLLWTWAFWHFRLHLFKQTRGQHLSVQPPLSGSLSLSHHEKKLW